MHIDVSNNSCFAKAITFLSSLDREAPIEYSYNKKTRAFVQRIARNSVYLYIIAFSSSPPLYIIIQNTFDSSLEILSLQCITQRCVVHNRLYSLSLQRGAKRSRRVEFANIIIKASGRH